MNTTVRDVLAKDIELQQRQIKKAVEIIRDISRALAETPPEVLALEIPEDSHCYTASDGKVQVWQRCYDSGKYWRSLDRKQERQPLFLRVLNAMGLDRVDSTRYPATNYSTPRQVFLFDSPEIPVQMEFTYCSKGDCRKVVVQHEMEICGDIPDGYHLVEELEAD